jgi:hypothetical protein
MIKELVVVFKNLTTMITPSFNDIFYHCDFVEINALARKGRGLDKDYLEELYPKKTHDDFTNLFSLIVARSNWYGEKYPFIVNYDDMRLTLKSDLTIGNKLYIFFLLCTRNEKVNYEGNVLESDFEYISTLALKKYLPEGAMVYHFGKSSYSEDRYIGKLVDKLLLLANDIKCMPTFDAGDFSDHDTGDGGLDVVAWVPFTNDTHNYMNIPVFLGQCAIGQNWTGKHYDVEKMKDNIRFPVGTASMMYVSHDLRKDTGKFKSTVSRAHMLFDRFRLVNQICDDPVIMEKIKTLNSFMNIISEVTKEDADILEV